MFCILVVRGTTDVIVSDVQSVENTKDDAEVVVINNEPFIPTHQWQRVKENQAIPAGLHVRMNFQTGINEAKLMDGDDENDQKKLENSAKGGPKIIASEESINGIHKNDEKLFFTKQRLKEALSEFKDKVGKKEIVDDITWSNDAKEALKEHSDEHGVYTEACHKVLLVFSLASFASPFIYN